MIAFEREGDLAIVSQSWENFSVLIELGPLQLKMSPKMNFGDIQFRIKIPS